MTPDGSAAPGQNGPTEEETPGGPFASWPRLYITLVIYGIAWVLLLYIVTQTLNIDLLGGGMGS
jgi:hypothetical protein